MKTHFLLLFAFLLGFVACTETPTETTTTVATVTEEPMADRLLRHVVLFQFKESATPEDIASIEEAFKALPAAIPEIHDFEWGINNSPEGLNKGLTHCFFLTFKSEEDRAVYLPHPQHKAFGELLGPHLEDVTVVDYWMDR